MGIISFLYRALSLCLILFNKVTLNSIQIFRLWIRLGNSIPVDLNFRNLSAVLQRIWRLFSDSDDENGRMPVPYNSIDHAFVVQARLHPHVNAVVDYDGCSITYGHLGVLSGRLAAVLRDRGIGRGETVCLLIQRSIAQVVAIISILHSGASYLPLDGSNVTEHTLLTVMAEVRPAYTLISKCHLGLAQYIPYPHGCIEDIIAHSQQQPYSPPRHISRLCDTAYIIYTSGTTGRPKGVCVSHLNVMNLVCLAPGNLGISSGTRVAQLLNPAFDMCAWETLGCLTNGGTLYLRGPRRVHWIQVLRTVDVVICTPPILALHEPRDYPNIKLVATAGEPCPQALADKWAEHVTFYNCCGPTEVTIVNTMHRHVSGGPLTIGKPTPNNFVYILDDDMRTLPQGAVGIMWAGGLGVCQGYIKQNELNRRKFALDPFSKGGGVMYNTEDLGRLRSDGEFDWLGRIDDQVKVKGFRVELQGVASAMRECPGVTAACALLIQDELWGFYSPNNISIEEVRDVITHRQPRYAVPVKFMALPALPLTANGKVDKSNLKRLAHCTEVSNP